MVLGDVSKCSMISSTGIPDQAQGWRTRERGFPSMGERPWRFLGHLCAKLN
jgi:hypothetical protein